MSSYRPAVLVVDDEPQIRRFLRASLQAEGLEVVEAETGARSLALAKSGKIDCLVLDLGLPDMEGVDVIRRLREYSALPIIVLSARTLEGQKIAALDAGADDYVSKPFGIGELLARLRVALRHAATSVDATPALVFQSGNVHVDLGARRVMLSGCEVHLTPTEYRLLATLVKHAGKVLTQRFLLKEVWGGAYVERPHYLRVYMANLRQKLESDPARPVLLLTETGVGYRLSSE